MKNILSLAAAILLLSGCAVYHDGRYDDGYKKKPHPHGCPPGQAKKGNC